MIAYSAEKIFTGYDWLNNHSILVEDGTIREVMQTDMLPYDIDEVKFEWNMIVPAFIDLQIYGAGGKLLAMFPEVDALTRLQQHCLQGGTHYCLPTVATNEYEVFYNCIDAVKAYWTNGGTGILGLHIEGPWINVAKRGAHKANLIHAPTLEQARHLLEYGKGIIKMITLAPEVCSIEVVGLIQSYGVVVSAGHTNATFNEATTAFDKGIPVATHLFNAMSPLQHRQPGMVGAIMHHRSAMASIIPDGHHVDFEAVAIAKKIMGERLFMITDAVTETDSGPYPHQPEGDKFVSDGILSGSALTMLKGVQNCVQKIGISLDEALRMAALYPAKVIGLQNQLGSIARGQKADLLVLNERLSIVDQVTGYN